MHMPVEESVRVHVESMHACIRPLKAEYMHILLEESLSIHAEATARIHAYICPDMI